MQTAMNEMSSQGAQKRIDFYGRWSLALFAVFVVLAGWIGTNIRAGKYDTMFQFGVGCAMVAAVGCIGFTWVTHRRIKRLEESKNE
ncbi:MAG: hypothetical protein OXU61_11610 [Gammaproteobacteria bacterium]|nr:hypothetical protein [Gammaproteobacteria bacterium]